MCWRSSACFRIQGVTSARFARSFKRNDGLFCECRLAKSFKQGGLYLHLAFRQRSYCAGDRQVAFAVARVNHDVSVGRQAIFQSRPFRFRIYIRTDRDTMRKIRSRVSSFSQMPPHIKVHADFVFSPLQHALQSGTQHPSLYFSQSLTRFFRAMG